MQIITASGSRYAAEVRQTSRGPCLFVSKDGQSWDACVAVYPDRLRFLMATVEVRQEGMAAVGRNANGVVTLRVVPDQVRKGIILANRRGLRSTEIVSVLR